MDNQDYQLILNEIYGLRKKLHAIPELAFHEQKTMACVKAFLKEKTGLEITEYDKWFYAFYDGGDELPPIAFRAEFDAVEGMDGCAGHYCGHDGHTAVMSGLAMMLEKIKPRRRVYLIYQPAEEIGEGSRVCRELLKEKNIPEIYAFHNIPEFPKDKILIRNSTFACGSTGLSIHLTGAPSHAAYPEHGRNPGLLIAQLIVKMDAWLSQPHRGMVLGTIIGVDLGSDAYGVSASEGTLRLTIRGEYGDEFEALVDFMKNEAAKGAEAGGFACEIKEIERFAATENTDECVEKLRRATALAGEEEYAMAQPMRWSEDFGYYLEYAKGAYFGVGDGEDYPEVHTEGFEFPDSIVPHVLKVYEQLLGL